MCNRGKKETDYLENKSKGANKQFSRNKKQLVKEKGVFER